MNDLLTALAGLALVAVFPIAIIAAYRMNKREEENLQEDLERDTIERRARRHQ